MSNWSTLTRRRIEIERLLSNSWRETPRSGSSSLEDTLVKCMPLIKEETLLKSSEDCHKSVFQRSQRCLRITTHTQFFLTNKSWLQSLDWSTWTQTLRMQVTWQCWITNSLSNSFLNWHSFASRDHRSTRATSLLWSPWMPSWPNLSKQLGTEENQHNFMRTLMLLPWMIGS